MECDKSTTNTKLVEEPMFFDSYEQVLQYYENYAKQEGFAVFSRTSTKGEGNKIYKILSCCREGQRVSKSKNEFRMKPYAGTNCKARINILLVLMEVA